MYKFYNTYVSVTVFSSLFQVGVSLLGVLTDVPLEVDPKQPQKASTSVPDLDVGLDRATLYLTLELAMTSSMHLQDSDFKDLEAGVDRSPRHISNVNFTPAGHS